MNAQLPFPQFNKMMPGFAVPAISSTDNGFPTGFYIDLIVLCDLSLKHKIITKIYNHGWRRKHERYDHQFEEQ